MNELIICLCLLAPPSFQAQLQTQFDFLELARLREYYLNKNDIENLRFLDKLNSSIDKSMLAPPPIIDLTFEDQKAEYRKVISIINHRMNSIQSCLVSIGNNDNPKFYSKQILKLVKELEFFTSKDFIKSKQLQMHLRNGYYQKVMILALYIRRENTDIKILCKVFLESKEKLREIKYWWSGKRLSRYLERCN